MSLNTKDLHSCDEQYVDSAIALSDNAQFIGGEDCHDIASGHAGYSLMFTHLARSFRTSKVDEKVVTMLTKRSLQHLINAAEAWKITERQSIGLFDGVAGYIFAVDAYDKLVGNTSGRSIRMATSLREEILKSLQDESITPDFYQQFYDVISGVAGALATCQYIVPVNSANRMIQVLQLFSVNREDPAKSYFYLRRNFPSEDLEQRYPKGYIDFGVAHGISGIIPRLVFGSGSSHDGVPAYPDLRSTIEWVVTASLSRAHSGAWTTFDAANDADPEPYSELLWCYGQLSRMVNILTVPPEYLTNTAIKKLESYMEATLTLDRISESVTSVEKLQSFGLCHGLSGLLMTVDFALKQNTHIDCSRKHEIRNFIYETAKNLNTDVKYRDLRTRDCVNSGLLNGGAGCLTARLALLERENEQNKRELRFLLFGV